MKEELIKKLKAIKEIDGDPEISHLRADEALLEYIGDIEVIELFASINKWYA